MVESLQTFVLNSQEYHLLLSELEKHLSEEKWRETEKRRNLLNIFLARVFEELCHYYLCENVDFEEKLLGSQDTFIFYKRLYPNTKSLKKLFNSWDIKGISVPDDLLVSEKEGKVVTVYEYTTRRTLNFDYYIRKKAYGLKSRKREYPGIFSGSRLIFVVPTIDEVKIPWREIGDKAEVMEIGITSHDFLETMSNVLGGRFSENPSLIPKSGFDETKFR